MSIVPFKIDKRRMIFNTSSRSVSPNGMTILLVSLPPDNNVERKLKEITSRVFCTGVGLIDCWGTPKVFVAGASCCSPIDKLCKCLCGEGMVQ
jgi:hypothetical protein